MCANYLITFGSALNSAHANWILSDLEDDASSLKNPSPRYFANTTALLSSLSLSFCSGKHTYLNSLPILSKVSTSFGHL